MLLDDILEFSEHPDLEITAQHPASEPSLICKCQLTLLEDIVAYEGVIRRGRLDDLNEFMLAHLVLVLCQDILQLIFWSLNRNNRHVDLMETILSKYLCDKMGNDSNLNVLIVQWVDAVLAR